MARSAAFQKRLKRHVVGRVRDYFAATAPGLEPWCRAELLALPLSVREVRTAPGGVAFKGRLADCYLANLHLRCANRILLRVARFKATGFGAFSNHLTRVAWELFLPEGTLPDVRVSVHRCRLRHTAAIKQRVGDVLSGTGGGIGPETASETSTAAGQRLFVRGMDDRFTVSVDSSGENLYLRGLKSQGGPAPIRETLAAAVLKAAGYRPGRTLIDPMCGTGTFSLEAAMMARNIPAGWFRSFAFTSWPSFQARRWAHMRRQCEQRFVDPPGPVIFASDRSQSAVAGLENIVAACGLSRTICVAEADFFTLAPDALSPTPGLVVVNPPYGRRLGSRQASRQLVVRIARRLCDGYPGWRFALLVPEKEDAARILRPQSIRAVSHGGLRLHLLCGRIRCGR